MNYESTYIILFSVATAVAIIVRRMRMPFTVALVLTGLALGALHAVEPPHLTKELLFALFLPGLLFEAAFHLEFADFKRNWIAIISLALPGLVGSVVLTALFVVLAMSGLAIDPAFTWTFGLVFGGLIAATDPVAVTALFKQLHAPRRLSVLVEGESLLNDGTSVVFLTLILSLASGVVPSNGELVRQFVMVVGGGALVGGVLGFGLSQVIRRVDEPMIEITLTTIAAYGSFAFAEGLHQSGVIATVVAGMICGSYGRPTGMSPTTRLAVESFWEYLSFALNSVVFLLIGFEVSIGALRDSWKEILVAYLAVTIARASVVTIVTLLLRRTSERISLSWISVLTWGGLRGALSMVLALALPFDFPHRAQLITMTAGVVVLSLVVQGMTMSPLMRRLGLVNDDQSATDYAEARMRLQLARAGLDEIDRMTAEHSAPAHLLADLKANYETRRLTAETEMHNLLAKNLALSTSESVRIERELVKHEMDMLRDAQRAGAISVHAFEDLLANRATRIAQLEHGDSGNGDKSNAE